MNKWLNRAANLFLLLLCTSCLLRLIQVSFQLTVAPKVYGWLALLCILLWAAVFFRRAFLPGTLTAAAVLWLLIRYGGEKLRPELLDILRAVRLSWLSGFGSEGGAVFQASTESHSLALLLILSAAAAYLAAVLSGKSMRINLSLLLTLPVVVMCLAVNRDPPALPLLGMGLFWTELVIGGDTYRPQDAAGRTVLLTLLPCLAVLGAALLYHSPENYVPENKAAMLNQRIEQLSSAVSSYLEKRPGIPQMIQGLGRRSNALSGWDQGEDTLDLTRPYDFSAGAHEVFTFRSSAGGSLYLRGRSLGDYTGTGWGKAEEQTGSQALNYAAYAAIMADYTGVGSVMSHSFTLEADRAYDTLFLPYFTICDSPGDCAIPADGRSAYTGEFLLLTGGSFGPLPESLRQEERQYRSFVREYYTRLPDSTRDALLALARQNGLNSEDSGIIAAVVDYVCRGSSYDLSVAPYPGNDYALYFLQNARRGYCVHYATAACCLYRALGIPARVCEGFLVTARSGAETSVRAADAHAWVEVWVDGVGWIPVEVTYGGTEENGSGDPSPDETETAQPEDAGDPYSLPADQESGNADERTEISPDGSGAAPLEGSDPGEGAFRPDSGGEKSGESRESPPDDPTPTPSDEKDSPPEKDSGSFSTGGVLLAALGVLVAAAVGRYALLRGRLRRQFSEPDGRRRAVYLYRQAQRVLRFGGEMPEAIQTAAEKASFSPHSISEEELQRSMEALNTLTDQVQRGLSPLRRLLFRYALGL